MVTRMVDLCKCEGTGCPLKETCYRFTAYDDLYQSYFTDVPYDESKKECERYIKRMESKND